MADILQFRSRRRPIDPRAVHQHVDQPIWDDDDGDDLRGARGIIASVAFALVAWVAIWIAAASHYL